MFLFSFDRYAVGGKKIGPDDPLSDQVGGIIGGGPDETGGEAEVGEMIKRWFGL